jgi:polyphosphate kinase
MTAMTKKVYFNRELSWLQFNRRVLAEARNPANPALEQLKFLAITASNLDEFFMVRVGGLLSACKAGRIKRDIAGLTPRAQLQLVEKEVRAINDDQYLCFNTVIEPSLAQAGVTRLNAEQMSAAQQSFLFTLFSEELFPCMTPMRINPRGRTPLIRSLALYCAVRVMDENDSREHLALLPLPSFRPRILDLPSPEGYRFILIEDAVKKYIQNWFPGQRIKECVSFRITRNADMAVQEEEAPDLLSGMEDVLEERKTSDCVRLEIDETASRRIIGMLHSLLRTDNSQTYLQKGPLDLKAFMPLTSVNGFDSLKVEPWNPSPSPAILPHKSLFAQISQGDILLHHPYESFDPVVRLIEEAAADPDVIAIKQVLYRTSKESPVVSALKRAAARGKSVTVLVELKARFDEARNIEDAAELEKAGTQVIYGVKGFKTHAKICLIVRREKHGIARYAHFGTGNYNDITARLYGDIGLMTRNDDLCADAATFFNVIGAHTQPQPMRKAVMAPLHLRDHLLELIDLEIKMNRKGSRGRIAVKINSLADKTLIDKLYQASCAGVKIDLNVRGICCLVPGVKGLSENITVTSIVDRYLEHARIFYFRHGGNEKFFISSADWMPRNLDGRFELMVPVNSAPCRERVKFILQTSLSDTARSWKLESDGTYSPSVKKGGKVIRAQEIFQRAASDAASEASRLRSTRFEPHRPEQ